jgi:cytoskeleton protein RodZ
MPVARSRLLSYDDPVIRGEHPLAAQAPVGEFGDKFRKAREKKDISLDDVSNVTKISSRMLQAIEEERFDLLPGGVFNKGFIRAYAKHLGLNGEEAVTDYLACLRQAQIDAQQVWADRPAAAPQPPAAAKPDYQKPNLTKHGQVQVEEELPQLQLPRAEDVRPPRKGYPVRLSSGFSWRFPAVAAVILVLVGSLLWIRHSRSLHTEVAASAKSVQPSSAVPPVAATTSAPAAAANSSSGVSQPPAANAPVAVTEKPAPSLKTENSENSEANDVTVRTFPAAKPATHKTPAKPIASLKLIIRASETTWIAVTADGQPVTHETLIAPAAISVHATREIVARIGNAAGVSFLFNDQEIPAEGAEAEVKTYVFDSTGMHAAATQEPAPAH